MVGYVGRLEQSKGVSTLIHALAESGVECTLLVVGEGPARAEWTSLAQNLGVNVRWLGKVSNRDIPRYLNCLDVLVLPSETTKHWAEQFGKVIVEAMACEVSVIGSDSGEIPTVIGDAGLVFSERNSTELANRIQLVADNKQLRALLGRKGRQRVLSAYSWDAVAKQTLAFYSELLRS